MSIVSRPRNSRLSGNSPQSKPWTIKVFDQTYTLRVVPRKEIDGKPFHVNADTRFVSIAAGERVAEMASRAVETIIMASDWRKETAQARLAADAAAFDEFYAATQAMLDRLGVPVSESNEPILMPDGSHRRLYQISEQQDRRFGAAFIGPKLDAAWPPAEAETPVVAS